MVHPATWFGRSWTACVKVVRNTPEESDTLNSLITQGFILARSIEISSSVTSLKEDLLWLGELMWAELRFKSCGKLLFM